MLNPVNWLTLLALGLVAYGAIIVGRPAWFVRPPISERSAAEERACRQSNGAVSVRMASDRHYWVDVVVFRRWHGDARVRMLADSGASYTTLSHGDARRLGLTVQPDGYRIPVSTANGVIRAAAWHVPAVHIGALCFWQPVVLIAPPGTLDSSVLGMDVINAVGSFRIEQGVMTLARR